MTERPSGAIHAREGKRTPWGGLLNYILGPIFYWLDLLDNDRRPAHGKIMWTIAFAFALAMLVSAWKVVFLDADNPTSTEMAFVLAFGALTFGLAGGLDGFKVWAKTKGGGTVSAFQDVAKDALEHPGKALEEPPTDG